MGRVDGVDDPAGLLLGGSFADLLREHAVARISLLDPFAQRLLDRGISLGHKRAIRFPIDAKVPPKKPHSDFVGLIGQFHGKGRQLVALAQARILAPVGSKSGSVPIMAGTQRPKTWISVFVPGLA